MPGQAPQRALAWATRGSSLSARGIPRGCGRYERQAVGSRENQGRVGNSVFKIQKSEVGGRNASGGEWVFTVAPCSRGELRRTLTSGQGFDSKCGSPTGGMPLRSRGLARRERSTLLAACASRFALAAPFA